MNNSIQVDNSRTHSQDEKIKAAYALNMCTVSVSQIIDYNDLYILEQEYDAILNNLNLKEMPKDEALLRTITELLNVITFFRIQEIKKSQIEKKYQRRIKNAIWSAVPNISVIASGNPVAIAFSLATQIGTGYMNYRREKSNAAVEKEDAEIELQITAIEQFNALKRELFTTAWRLADEYDFDDEWRLTEKQIKQYNEILLDNNEYRKYARLEAISDKFAAYPPFWYFFGHTANYIAETARKQIAQNEPAILEIVETYSGLAKKHYEHYYTLTKNSILREDQLTASCALEYVDLLWNEGEKNLDKIYKLLKLAEKMSPNSFDIIQLCAISYLKIGESDDAARLLKILVNEEYNSTANAKLLSRVYVSKYISSGDKRAYSDYQLLTTQVDPLYLYPLPQVLSGGNQKSAMEDQFIQTQKAILVKSYRQSLNAYVVAQYAKFNDVLPLPASKRRGDRVKSSIGVDRKKEIIKATLNCEGSDKDEKDAYVRCLSEINFRVRYIDILNETISGLEDLSCFRGLEKHDQLLYIIEGKLRLARKEFEKLQEQMNNGRFYFEDYLKLTDKYSYQYFTESFFDKLKASIATPIKLANDMKALDVLDIELIDFCKKFKLPDPSEYLHMYKPREFHSISNSQGTFFSYNLIGVEGSVQNLDELRKSMIQIVKGNIENVVNNPENVSILMYDDLEFNTYLQNENLMISNGDLYQLRKSAFAIIDDKTKSNFDLILGAEGITVIAKNRVKSTVRYENVKYASGKSQELQLGFPDVYTNGDVNIALLKAIIDKLSECTNSFNIL